MKKEMIGLLVTLVFLGGCMSTKESEENCDNKQVVSGVISDVLIDGGTYSDNVVLEFEDGRVMTLIKWHDMTTAFHKGKMHTITGKSSRIYRIEVEETK